MSLFKRLEKRATSSALIGGVANEWFQRVESPKYPTVNGPVGPRRARMLTAVWACQSLIADSIASLPVCSYRRVKGTGRKQSIDNPKWVDSPNPFMTPYTFWHTVLISMLGEDGNTFVFTPRDSNNNVVSVWPLDPWLVTVDEESPVPHYWVGGEEFWEDDIVHIPAFSIPGWRRGLSVIDHAREAIGLGLAQEEFGARFFAQGTTMSGIVEHPGKPNPGEIAVLAKMLKKNHAGIKNSHAVGILTGGAKWQNVSITPEQAQFLESRRFQNIQIAQLYRVPPHLIDPTVSSTWGTGIEEQNRAFVDWTLIPWLVRLEQAFSRLLPANNFIRFDVDAMLRGKQAERFKAYSLAIESGFMNPDEARTAEDYEPIPGGKGQKFYHRNYLIEMGKEVYDSKPTTPINVPEGSLAAEALEQPAADSNTTSNKGNSDGNN